MAELGRHLAFDGQHLLAAAQTGRVFVTHNGKGFITLHDAWIRWPAAWGIASTHAGILNIPQRWKPPVVVQEITRFLRSRASPPNELWGWDNDVQQWVQNPLPKRR